MKFDIKSIMKLLTLFKKTKKVVDDVKTVASALKSQRGVHKQIIGRAQRQSPPNQSVVMYDTFNDPGYGSSKSSSKSSSSSSSDSSSSSSSDSSSSSSSDSSSSSSSSSCD